MGLFMSENSSYVAVIIVGFGNSSDIRDCLTALALSPLSPSFDIFICENGSEEDFEKLNNALVTADGPCNICPNRPEAIDLLFFGSLCRSRMFST